MANKDLGRQKKDNNAQEGIYDGTGREAFEDSFDHGDGRAFGLPRDFKPPSPSPSPRHQPPLPLGAFHPLLTLHRAPTPTPTTPPNPTYPQSAQVSAGADPGGVLGYDTLSRPRFDHTSNNPGQGFHGYSASWSVGIDTHESQYVGIAGNPFDSRNARLPVSGYLPQDNNTLNGERLGGALAPGRDLADYRQILHPKQQPYSHPGPAWNFDYTQKLEKNGVSPKRARTEVPEPEEAGVYPKNPWAQVAESCAAMKREADMKREAGARRKSFDAAFLPRVRAARDDELLQPLTMDHQDDRLLPAEDNRLSSAEDVVDDTPLPLDEDSYISEELGELGEWFHDNPLEPEAPHQPPVKRQRPSPVVEMMDMMQVSEEEEEKIQPQAPETHQAPKTHQLLNVEEADIDDKDILLGRGGKTNHHPGNATYLQLIQEKEMEYFLLASRNEKTVYAMGLVQQLRARGIRFLKRDKRNKKLWNDVGDDKMREKVSQNLRENQPQLRKELEQSSDNPQRQEKSNSGRSQHRDSLVGMETVSQEEVTSPPTTMLTFEEQQVLEEPNLNDQLQNGESA